jgi:hypothetical protein
LAPAGNDKAAAAGPLDLACEEKTPTQASCYSCVKVGATVGHEEQNTDLRNDWLSLVLVGKATPPFQW